MVTTVPVESVPVPCCNLNAVNVPPLPPVIVSPSTNEPLWFFAFTICKVVSTETISAVTLLVPPVIVSPSVKVPLWFFNFSICLVVSIETTVAVTPLEAPVAVSSSVVVPERDVYKIYVGNFIVGAGLAA